MMAWRAAAATRDRFAPFRGKNRPVRSPTSAPPLELSAGKLHSIENRRAGCPDLAARHREWCKYRDPEEVRLDPELERSGNGRRGRETRLTRLRHGAKAAKMTVAAKQLGHKHTH